MKTLRFAVLAYGGCMPMQLFAIADVLRIAGDMDVNLGARRGIRIDVQLVGLPGHRLVVAGGVPLTLKRPVGRYDLLIVPGLGTPPQQDWPAKLAALSREVAFIRRSFARGTAVASVCLGAFLLGEAGLLDGRRVTTAWLFADALASRYPAARVSPEAMVVDDGAVITTGAVSSAFDLVLHLAKRHLGADVAAATAAVSLLANQRESQSPYVDSHLRRRELPTFSQNLARWFEARLSQAYDLDTVARAFHVSGRTLMRRVKAETGRSPLTLLQEARIDRSKRLLHDTHWPIVRIVEAVGYSDVVSFARLFARQVGESPAKFRQRRVELDPVGGD